MYNDAWRNDKITLYDVKIGGEGLVKLLTFLINKCISEVYYPEFLKISLIRPIYKKGSHSDYNNYRPIALSSILDKIFQKYIGNCLYKFLINNDLINDRQYAYQKGKSANILLSKVSNFINENLSEGKHVIGLFIDYTKVFEMLDHDILISELDKIGVRGHVKGLIKNFLMNRKVMVEINKCKSEIKITNTGVPQGSNLGPILFLIYVNSVFKIFKNYEIFMFADDFLIMVSDKNFNEANNTMQRNINQLIRWSHDNKLIINVNKTKVVHFYNQYLRKNETVDLIMHTNNCLHNFANDCACKKVEVVKEIKYLGVMLDQDMTWNAHINSITRKLRSIIPQIYMLKVRVSEKMLRSIYFGLVHPFLLYGITSWGFAETGTFSNLKKMQTRIIKKMKTGDKISNSNDLYKYWNVMPITNTAKYCLLKENYFTDWGGVPRQHEYSTRTIQTTPFFVPLRENRFHSKTIKYILPRIWNEIPVELKNITEYSLLTIGLKNYFNCLDVP